MELDYDEGPFYQTERYPLYKEKIKELLANGKAYPVRLHAGGAGRQTTVGAKRKTQTRLRRHLSAGGRRDPAAAKDKPYTVRFRSPRDGSTIVKDLIKGDVVFDNRELDDLIIARSDGTPTYNFCVVVDDIEMEHHPYHSRRRSSFQYAAANPAL